MFSQQLFMHFPMRLVTAPGPSFKVSWAAGRYAAESRSLWWPSTPRASIMDGVFWLMKSLVFWLDLHKRFLMVFDGFWWFLMVFDGFWWFLMVFAVFIGKIYIYIYRNSPTKMVIWSLNMRIWHGWSMKQWGVYVNLPRPQPRYILNPENHQFL